MVTSIFSFSYIVLRSQGCKKPSLCGKGLNMMSHYLSSICKAISSLIFTQAFTHFIHVGVVATVSDFIFPVFFLSADSALFRDDEQSPEGCLRWFFSALSAALAPKLLKEQLLWRPAFFPGIKPLDGTSSFGFFDTELDLLGKLSFLSDCLSIRHKTPRHDLRNEGLTLPIYKMIHRFKFKALADHNLNVARMAKFVCKRLKKTLLRKEELLVTSIFSLFSKCFKRLHSLGC